MARSPRSTCVNCDQRRVLIGGLCRDCIAEEEFGQQQHEAWLTEKMTFRQGDKVRVKLRPGCQRFTPLLVDEMGAHQDGIGHTVPLFGHPLEEDGQLGRVWADDEYPLDVEGHPYRVEFEGDVACSRDGVTTYLNSDYFAADELELIVNAREVTDADRAWGEDSAAQQLERGPR